MTSNAKKGLEEPGVTVLRFVDLDVKKNIGWVLDEIKHWIKNNEPTPDPSQEGNT